jgi:hypothetical protein
MCQESVRQWKRTAAAVCITERQWAGVIRAQSWKLFEDEQQKNMCGKWSYSMQEAWRLESLTPTTESQKTRVPAEAVIPEEELSGREVSSAVFNVEACWLTAWESLTEHTQFTSLICLDKLSCHYVITGRNRGTITQKSHPAAKEIAVPRNRII